MVGDHDELGICRFILTIVDDFDFPQLWKSHSIILDILAYVFVYYGEVSLRNEKITYTTDNRRNNYREYN